MIHIIGAILAAVISGTIIELVRMKLRQWRRKKNVS